ncbi:MAG: MotA/TolQ/ExbB proton channel family protein [Chthoniobacterales bacterium]
MLEIFQKGGPLMWVLLLFSTVAIGAFIERIFHLYRCTISTADFLRGIATLIRRGDIGEAIQEAALTPGPVARVVHTLLLRGEADAVELRVVGEESARLEIPELERGLPLLSSIAYASPLIGLLGTLLGLLGSFSSISSQGIYTTTAEIAGGVFQSIITSTAGLAVAIPVYFAYAYLGARVDGVIADMERAAIEVSHLLLERRGKEKRSPADAAKH